MKRLGSLFVASILACSSTAEDDTDSGNNAGSGASESSSSTGSPDSDTATATANTESASGTQSTSSAGTSTDGGSAGSSGSRESSGSSGGSSGSSEGSSSTGSSSSTGDLDPSQRCADTGGTWDEAACGHYTCGVPNPCAAIIPGCDCGPDANFVDGEGCVVDEACNTFSCFEQIECVVGLEYCEVTVPGQKGAPLSYACVDIPKACADMVECACLEDQLEPPPDACNEPTEDGLVVQIFLP